jgi:hypothetical protein
MFCPQCRAEYRAGFTRCADCDVDLVAELPAHALVAIEPLNDFEGEGDTADSNGDPFVSFWKGDEPRIHAELCQLFSDSNIPYRTIRRQDRLFHFSARTAFQIGIPFSKFDEAEALIKEAYSDYEGVQPESKLLPFDPSGDGARD